ncbi:DNA mismatch repair endonuclease MutL [Mariprofundus erugo]|uniref:DNA mismatch repair protein MutL n=1 Tax=Mariprofundus erugo TaxID=2528639 RepID=A0A5R9GNS9_9PROT|nr:DNA mismatch repair endonuclease MutL [Mariprofundus erugo]TLS67640.1 DNA mismatch repair endonuclease MutL [Mariprofundus erugo]TLS73847.1 DNA mismatch repair endonuclease MutL [Mariprofundus erugo]
MSDHLIHILSPQVANQIAAGEVVERPASAVKELVENSIDAGAAAVTVRVEGAGKRRIEVDDDGFGMGAADAALALQRHATSKIESSEDLHRIASHGFRGEALPSIASVSRFRMQTALAGASEGIEVRVDGGGETVVRPAAPRRGTRIEVLDLFLNTPARLNFMRSDKTEEAAIIDVFRALALANPPVAMRLEVDGRTRLEYPVQAERARVLAIMGDQFADNCIEQVIEHDGMRISAWLGLPTFHHRDSNRMMFLVNGRVIRDKQLIAALRAGYRDVIFHDRYPVAVIRIEIDPADVDINVHPAKREVKFKSPQSVSAGIVACVRAGIERMGQVVASTTTDQALYTLQRSAGTSSPPSVREPLSSMPRFSSGAFQSGGGQRSLPPAMNRMLFSAPASMRGGEPVTVAADASSPLDLGRPLAQVHRCYILAQTDSGVVLVDQHAAHERMTYERLKAQLAGGSIATQMLLTPESLTLSGEAAAWLADHSDELHRFGVELEVAGHEVFLIRSVPAMLVGEPLLELVAELVDSCRLLGADAEAGSSGGARILERWLGNRACKGSIKSGRLLSHDEQELLLREMERTPNIAQCNHGRPTYVRLSLAELDRLFGRQE